MDLPTELQQVGGGGFCFVSSVGGCLRREGDESHQFSSNGRVVLPQRVTDIPFDGSGDMTTKPDICSLSLDFVHRFCEICHLEEPRRALLHGAWRPSRISCRLYVSWVLLGKIGENHDWVFSSLLSMLLFLLLNARFAEQQSCK